MSSVVLDSLALPEEEQEEKQDSRPITSSQSTKNQMNDFTNAAIVMSST